MNEQALQQYLYGHIPLSHAMQMRIVQIQEDEMVVAAPLAPNINHRETIFGGSASAIAILAAWSLLHVKLQRGGIASRLVIQSNTMQYDLPIAGDFIARARLAETEDWDRFVRMLTRRGKARIGVDVVLEYEGCQAGRLHGEFVALAGATD